MNALLLISHSKKITDGLKEMIEEMIGDTKKVEIFSLGGASDGRLGTDGMKIYSCIEKCLYMNEIYIFCDIGSSVLCAEMAIDMLKEENKDRVHLMDSPLVEGAFAAAVPLSIGQSKELVLSELNKI